MVMKDSTMTFWIIKMLFGAIVALKTPLAGSFLVRFSLDMAEHWECLDIATLHPGSLIEALCKVS